MNKRKYLGIFTLSIIFMSVQARSETELEKEMAKLELFKAQMAVLEQKVTLLQKIETLSNSKNSEVQATAKSMAKNVSSINVSSLNLDDQDDKPPKNPSRFALSLESGFVSTAGYQVKDNAGTLYIDEEGRETSSYMEVNLHNHSAWNTDYYTYRQEKPRALFDEGDGGFSWDMLEVDVLFGLNFDGDDSSQEALVKTGDFYMQAVAGVRLLTPFWEMPDADELAKVSADKEAAAKLYSETLDYGFASTLNLDLITSLSPNSADEILERYQIGPTWYFGGSIGGDRKVRGMVRVAAGWVDQLEVDGTTTVNGKTFSIIKGSPTGNPEYSLEFDVTPEIEISVDIKSGFNLIVGGRMDMMSDLNQYTFYIGGSMDFEALSKILGAAGKD
jgi:hypothetical protein